MKSILELSDLKGRRALVTGANGQLGRVFCETLAELGANLILVDLPDSDFESNKSHLWNRWGTEVECYPSDLEDESARAKLVGDFARSQRGLNILVNNAAFVGSSLLDGWNEPFEKQSLETWRRAFELNLTATFDLCKNLYPILKISEGASIVNIGSIYGSYGPDWRIYNGTKLNNPAAYAASKGGLIQLTRWLSTTMSPHVRVNAISPGGIRNTQQIEFVKAYEAKTPLGRMGKPQDIKGAMSFLASDLSEYVTGHILEVNGGWGVW